MDFASRFLNQHTSTLSDPSSQLLLKRVSRSFYLSLRVLPARMRHPASLGYLIARAADTIADESSLPSAHRLSILDAFHESLEDGRPFEIDLPTIAGCRLHADETELLRRLPMLSHELELLPAEEGALVRDVCKTITSGQRLDLTRFASVTGNSCGSLQNDEELWDYAWRVAGCVGEFWTRLGFLTLGSRFSRVPMEQLLVWGKRFGQALQLVNILRDLPHDLRSGRCYLPLADPSDAASLRAEHRRWCLMAVPLLQDGLLYAGAMRLRRLKVSAELPARLGLETLRRLDDQSLWSGAPGKIKVPRRRVYLFLMQSFLKPRMARWFQHG